MKLDRVTNAHDYLIEIKGKVVFFGEGNFSFSSTLACRRNSWDDIIATTLQGDIPDADSTKLCQVNGIIRGYSFTGDQEVTDADKFRWIRNAVTFNLATAVKKANVDATTFTLEEFKDYDAAFFQCPWIDGDIHKLILNFLLQASNAKMKKVFVGISTKCSNVMAIQTCY